MSQLKHHFTYITTCKGRLAHLKQTLPRLAAEPGIACVVVDYDCPDGTAAWVSANHPNVKVVRVTDTPGFSAARARNLGGAAATTEWLGFFDADILPAPQFFAEVLPQLKAGMHFRAQPLTRQTWGSVICRREDFELVGGYDEIYEGWGVEDDDLYEALKLNGVVAAGFAGALLSEVRHSDELRTRFHPISLIKSHRINSFYKQIKYDMMSLMRAPVPEQIRRSIYNNVRKEVLAESDGEKKPVKVTISLASCQIAPPRPDPSLPNAEHAIITRRLQYVLHMDAASARDGTITF